MTAGRPRKSAKIHLLRGTATPSRPLRKEPEPKVDLSPTDPYFNKMSTAERAMLRRLLDDMPPGFYKRVDCAKLRAFCAVSVEVQEFAEQVRNEGKTVNGKVSGAYRGLRYARADLSKLGSELGLDPGARARLGVAPSKLADPDFDPWNVLAANSK